MEGSSTFLLQRKEVENWSVRREFNLKGVKSFQTREASLNRDKHPENAEGPIP